MRSLSTLFITFIFYAFLGWCFEMVHMGITTKEIVNRGYLNGPIIPIYGAGMLSILILLKPFKKFVVLSTILIILICSILEYTTSYVMEKIYGIRWWDYEDKWLNLNGRICFETMSMFTGLALFVIYFLHPIFTKVIAEFSTTSLFIISLVLSFLFLGDFILSNMIVKDYLQSHIETLRKDKTPLIRQYTTKLLKDKF